MRVLTGVKPTATPHLGNLLGAIAPALQLATKHDATLFIADYHALTTLHDAAAMRRYRHSVAATWLAMGLDPSRTTIFVQSDVPEVMELTWLLSCVTGMGVLERAHAWKAARDKGEEISVGTANYPVLMAADILLYDTNLVPVGKDQKQHIEMCRDMASAFNHRFQQEVFVLPEPMIQEDMALIPGLDGRKMSKSYGNHIEIFLPPKELRKKVMSIVTDAKGLEEPKDPETCNVFAIYKLFATPAQVEELDARYRAGNFGYGHAKQALFEVLDAQLAPARARYHALMADPATLEDVLSIGASKARKTAQQTLERARSACGLGRVL